MRSNTTGAKLSHRSEIITPDMARKLLATMPSVQRNIRKGHVAYLKSAMDMGDWRGDTGEPIKIADTGELMDGQHRFAALIQHGEPCRFTVTRNVPIDNYAYEDNGVPRTDGDVLMQWGYQRTSLLAALLKWVKAYEVYIDGAAFRSASSKLPVHVLRDLLDRHKGIEESVAVADQNFVTGFIPGSILAFIHWGGRRSSPEMADRFITQTATGIGAGERSPVKALRNRIERSRMNGLRLTRRNMAHSTAKAWLFYEDGLESSRLSISDVEPFPLFNADQA